MDLVRGGDRAGSRRGRRHRTVAHLERCAFWRAASREAPLRSCWSVRLPSLPFENLSPEPNDALLAFGIAEAVLHQLANLNDLSVIARTSSFAVKDRGEDARAIGRRLNARYLLEGSVQSDKARLRVTAQLIDSETGKPRLVDALRQNAPGHLRCPG